MSLQMMSCLLVVLFVLLVEFTLIVFYVYHILFTSETLHAYLMFDECAVQTEEGLPYTYQEYCAMHQIFLLCCLHHNDHVS